jgi:hypothetical protein
VNNSRNVAVFIDAENLFKGYGKLEIPDMPIEQMLDQLEAAAAREAGAGTIALSRAYADWGAIGLEDFRRDVERAGVETVQARQKRTPRTLCWWSTLCAAPPTLSTLKSLCWFRPTATLCRWCAACMNWTST